jgi:hypothetical protein
MLTEGDIKELSLDTAAEVGSSCCAGVVMTTEDKGKDETREELVLP